MGTEYYDMVLSGMYKMLEEEEREGSFWCVQKKIEKDRDDSVLIVSFFGRRKDTYTLLL